MNRSASHWTADQTVGEQYRFNRRLMVAVLEKEVRRFLLGYRTVYVTILQEEMDRQPTLDEFYSLPSADYSFQTL